jgi:hypothetical protein
MVEGADFEREKIERLRRAMYSRQLSDKMGERPRHALEPENEALPQDWYESDPGTPGSMVAPRYIGATRKVLMWTLVASVVFFIAALGFFAFYFVLGGGSGGASPSNIDIAVSGPPQVAGGELTKLQVVVTNRNRVPLELADLVVTYPQGTRSPLDFSSDFPSQRISLGAIEPGGTRQGTVSAVFAGKAGEKQNVKVELEYRIANSSSIFVASQDYGLDFSSSPVAISVDGNTQTISGQPVQLDVTLSSNVSAPVKDVLLHVDYPFGFTFASADPAPVSSGLWAVGDLAPGERKTISLRGTLSGESGDNRTFRFSAGTRTSPTATDISTVLSNDTFAMEISQPFLGLAVTVNKQAGTVLAQPGDNVNVSVAYQNNLSTEISNAVIVARLSGLEIDGTTVRSSDGFYRSTDGTVLWDKTTTNGVLGTIAPGQKGVVSFSFQAPASTDLGSVTNPHLDISINAAGQRLSESGVPQNLQSAARGSVKLATDLQLNTQALYYANPFGSTGPMPPKAGTETTYALVFNVTNTTNKIVNAKITATLPSYVRWIGSHAPASEDLSFDQATGTFIWNIGELAPGVGIGATAPKQLAVAIGFTPSTSQIGQQPALVRNVTLTGIDGATGAAVTRTATPDVTTNLATIGKSSQTVFIGTDPGFSPANATVVK